MADRESTLLKLKKRKAQGQSGQNPLNESEPNQVSQESGKESVAAQDEKPVIPVTETLKPPAVVTPEPVQVKPVEKPMAPVHEELQVELVVSKPSSGGLELPARLKRNFMVDNDQGKEKTNLAIADDVVRQFNMLKTFAANKRVKTTTNGLASNILREWLLKNGEELEKAFGYKPYSQNQ